MGAVVMHTPMRSRSVELFLSVVMTLSGLMFLWPGDTLLNPVYVSLRRWVEVFPGNESSLGLILVVIGSVRIAALIINGRLRPTPLARAAGCMVGSLYWAVLSLAYIDAPIHGAPVGLAWSLTAIAFETFAAMKSAEDAFASDSLGLRERHRERLRHRGA